MRWSCEKSWDGPVPLVMEEMLTLSTLSPRVQLRTHRGADFRCSHAGRPMPQAGTELVPRNLPSWSAHPRCDPSEAPGAYAGCASSSNATGNCQLCRAPPTDSDVDSAGACLKTFGGTDRSVRSGPPVDRGCLWAEEPRADCCAESDITKQVSVRVAEQMLDVLVSERQKENAQVFQHAAGRVGTHRKADVGSVHG